MVKIVPVQMLRGKMGVLGYISTPKCENAMRYGPIEFFLDGCI